MRRMRIFSIVVFTMAVLIFGVYNIYSWRTEDHAGPRIIMEKDSITVSAKADMQELLAGIRAEDKKDGDVTDSLIMEGLGNFIEKGRRKMTVAAFDSDGHVTKISREIIYDDYESPVFGLHSPLRFPVDTENILSGMSAEDMLDGNLTANIKISGDYSLKNSTPGDYPMLFTVANSAGDVSELPVTVRIYDPAEEAKKPSIELSEYLVYTSPGEKINPWDYVRKITVGSREYERGKDGVLHDMHPSEGQKETTITGEEVQITQDFDYSVPGVYEILYQYDSADKRTGDIRLVVVIREQEGDGNGE